MITERCRCGGGWEQGLMGWTLGWALCLLAVGACGEDSGSSTHRGTPPRPPIEGGGEPAPEGGPIVPEGAAAPNLGQGGAQDIGELRAVLESGGIPGPGVLDEIGFFNVHRLDFPAPDCGEDICLHALLGSMGNMISGSNCTLVLIGMNTAVQPSDLPRPPVDLVVAVDTSAGAAPYLPHVRQGLTDLLETLSAADTVSLVAYDEQARLLADGEGQGSSSLPGVIALLRAEGGSDLYAGLRLAFEQAQTLSGPGRQARVLVVSASASDRGITSAARLREMAAGFAGSAIALTVLGTGAADGPLLRQLAASTSGNYLYYEDVSELAGAFANELATTLVPLAEDVTLSVTGGDDYWLGRIHGSTNAALLTDQRGIIHIPSLYLAQRTDAEPPVEGNRRGGGGGILAELIPVGAQDPTAVGQVTLDYRVPGTGERRTQTVSVTATVAPGDVPATGAFESSSVEKAFVMLNLYVGFELAAERAASADLLGALDILGALDVNVGLWLEDHPDIDIADDYGLLQLFIANVETEWDRWVVDDPSLEGSLGDPPSYDPDSPTPPPRPRPEPWPRD